jgi:hypothetical protein
MGQFGKTYSRSSRKHGVILYMDYWHEGERYREKIDPPAKNVTEARGITQGCVNESLAAYPLG